MSIFLPILVVLTTVFMSSVSPAAETPPPLQVVPSVDLERYQGVWHEVARLPNWFQKACAGETTATYTLRSDGKVDVLNQCRQANGKIKSANGTAKLADKQGPSSKLKVTFFWPFYGNYWILDLDSDYRWVAIGEPGRKYFWILSRTPELDKPILDGILERARAQGYDLSKLIMSQPQL
jgi:apolipoprotein D and lipocalin family protein